MFDPYGKVTVLDGNGTPRVVNESLYGNPWTFTGRRLDQETGLMQFRFRYYDTGLGRFIGRDPLGYVDGENTYAVYFVPSSVDPLGLYVFLRGQWTNRFINPPHADPTTGVAMEPHEILKKALEALCPSLSGKIEVDPGRRKFWVKPENCRCGAKCCKPVFDALCSDKVHINVAIFRPNQRKAPNQYDWRNKQIGWNPWRWYSVPTGPVGRADNKPMNPLAGLCHEFTHAWRDAFNVSLTGRQVQVGPAEIDTGIITTRAQRKSEVPDPNYGNQEEREVITGEESRMARERSGEPGWVERTGHHGTEIPGDFDWQGEGGNRSGAVPGL
jgi:RHS repeat-associated protein